MEELSRKPLSHPHHRVCVGTPQDRLSAASRWRTPSQADSLCAAIPPQPYVPQNVGHLSQHPKLLAPMETELLREHLFQFLGHGELPPELCVIQNCPRLSPSLPLP